MVMRETQERATHHTHTQWSGTGSQPWHATHYGRKPTCCVKLSWILRRTLACCKTDKIQPDVDTHHLQRITNWVVQALNADWLTAVVHQTVYHGYDTTFNLYCFNYIGNQFLIAIRHLGGLYGQYTTAKGCVKALHAALCIRTALSCGILALYHPLSVPYCLITGWPPGLT